MAFAVVLDTCVLYPAHLQDSLLRPAERGLYRALWSADIIEELHRNLIEVADPTAVGHLLGQMTYAFPVAEVSGHLPLSDRLTCDPKDRHVLAAAVRANAAAIVTFNTVDFPDHSTEPYAIKVIGPDTFLLDLLDLAPGAVTGELTQQAAANRREPRTLPRLIDALERAGVPAFADEVRRRTARPG